MFHDTSNNTVNSNQVTLISNTITLELDNTNIREIVLEFGPSFEIWFFWWIFSSRSCQHFKELSDNSVLYSEIKDHSKSGFKWTIRIIPMVSKRFRFSFF